MMKVQPAAGQLWRDWGGAARICGVVAAGLAWWNSLSETMRTYWCELAGKYVAADAWAYFKRARPEETAQLLQKRSLPPCSIIVGGRCHLLDGRRLKGSGYQIPDTPGLEDHARGCRRAKPVRDQPREAVRRLSHRCGCNPGTLRDRAGAGGLKRGNRAVHARRLVC